MSRGDFYENGFVTLEQYNDLVHKHGFNLSFNLFPRDIEAVRLEEHVKFLRDNTKLFDTVFEEDYYRTIEGPGGLAEKYNKILVAESPYNSYILKKANIKGRDFINFLKTSAGSESNTFFPLPRDDKGIYPLPREDYVLDRYSIGWKPQFLVENIDQHEFIIFTNDNLFM